MKNPRIFYNIDCIYLKWRASLNIAVYTPLCRVLIYTVYYTLYIIRVFIKALIYHVYRIIFNLNF